MKHYRLNHILLTQFLFWGLACASWAKPVIYDTDMAIDDWLALLFLAQHPDADLLAVTISASGESRCQPGLVNVGKLLALTNIATEPLIACGDDYPLDGYFVFPEAWREDSDTLSGIEPALIPGNKVQLETNHTTTDVETTPNIHDTTTTNQAILDSVKQSTRGKISKRHAAEVIHQTLHRADEAVTIVAVGPLTNIAQWLERYPDDVQRVERLVIMGGNLDTPGNIIVPKFTDGHPNTTAEWNFFIDPLAADKVLRSGLNIDLVGLDVTNLVRVTVPYAQEFKTQVSSRAAMFVDQVLDKNRWFIESNEYYYWDVLAAIISVSDDMCGPKPYALAVDHRVAEGKPYLKTSELTMPAQRWDGQARQHLSAKHSGALIPLPKASTPLSHDTHATQSAQRKHAPKQAMINVCKTTQASVAFERFTNTLNLP